MKRCYTCDIPVYLGVSLGRKQVGGKCRMCQQYYCFNHRNWMTLLCDECERHPETVASRRAPEPSNIGCSIIILTILCLVPIVILAIMLHLSQGATQAEIGDAGDPLSNTFFLVLAGLATLAFLFIFGSLMLSLIHI